MRYDVSKRSVNHRLIYWQQRSGLNNTRLAAAIRERAGERGHRQVQPDARRVRAWRHGERPRDPVPELILEVLFERIGTSLTLSGGLFIHCIFEFSALETLAVGTAESSPQFHRQR